MLRRRRGVGNLDETDMLALDEYRAQSQGRGRFRRSRRCGTVRRSETPRIRPADSVSEMPGPSSSTVTSSHAVPWLYPHPRFVAVGQRVADDVRKCPRQRRAVAGDEERSAAEPVQHHLAAGEPRRLYVVADHGQKVHGLLIISTDWRARQGSSASSRQASMPRESRVAFRLAERWARDERRRRIWSDTRPGPWELFCSGPSWISARVRSD